MTIFGRIIDGDDIRRAVSALLANWLPTYLAEVERQHDLAEGYYQRPRSFVSRGQIEKWPEEQLPSIIVISTGTNERPVKDGQGRYRAEWYIGVASVVSSVDIDATELMAQRYGAAVLAIMVQKQSLDQALDGTVRGVRWLDTRYNELPPEDGRTIMATRQVFSIEVDDIVSTKAGPLSPDPPDDPNEPYDDWPEVQTVTNTIEKEPIE